MSKRQHESPCLGISYYDPRENFNLNFSSCKLSETILEVQYLGLVFPFLLLSFLHLLIYSTNVYWPLLCDRDCVRGWWFRAKSNTHAVPRGLAVLWGERHNLERQCDEPLPGLCTLLREKLSVHSEVVEASQKQHLAWLLRLGVGTTPLDQVD